MKFLHSYFFLLAFLNWFITSLVPLTLPYRPPTLPRITGAMSRWQEMVRSLYPNCWAVGLSDLLPLVAKVVLKDILRESLCEYILKSFCQQEFDDINMRIDRNHKAFIGLTREKHPLSGISSVLSFTCQGALFRFL